MKRPTFDPAAPRTLGDHLRDGLRKANAARPMSFYLLFAIIAGLVLGSQLLESRDDPRRYALFLSLHFVFFFAIILAALLDGIGIIRRTFRERETLYRETLGDQGFVQQLGSRIAANRRRRPRDLGRL